MKLNSLFFPRFRKSESEVFPDHLQKNLHNLVMFILKYSTHSIKLETSLEICSKSCIAANLNSSISQLHAINLEITHIQQIILSIESKIQELDSLESSLEGSDGSQRLTADLTGKVYQFDKKESLHKQLELYRLLLKNKYVQEKSTRNLYNALRTNRGNSLERHKIVSILKQSSLHEAQFRKILDEYYDLS